MKTISILLLLFVSVYTNAQSFSSPESVEYDVIHQRYIVANTSASNLQQVIPGSAPTLFKSGVSSPYGICIVGDTVYVCSSGNLKGYNLTTGNPAINIALGGNFLNGICTDFAGNIFVTDFGDKKIFRYNIASQQFNYFVGTAMTYTPNGIVFDPFHHRLVVATWGANAPILGLSLVDSTISTLKPTTLTNIDGLTIDEDGNFYAAIWGADGIYFFDSAFVNTPSKILTFANGTNAADISYNVLSDTLAVPNTGLNTVTYYGFPRPKPTNDFANATVAVSQSICVLQNDLIDGNAPLVLQSFSTPQLGTAGMNGNCIDYTASSVGNDTITYVVCSVDTPSFCRTGILVVTNSLGAGNNAPVANDDTASTTQPNSITVNVVANDLDADLADTLCVTSVYGSNFFSLDGAHCGNVIFTPDSSFVGNDTCWYVLCDNGNPVLCDTGRLVVNVVGNPSLLPVPSFTSDDASIFSCSNFISAQQTYPIENISLNADSILWTLTVISSNSPCFDSSFYFHSDTLLLRLDGLNHQCFCSCSRNDSAILCLTVFNQYGSNSICDTICGIYIPEGISEISLSNISLFPNPANNILTIDMQNNSEEIVRSYSSIEIVNALGQKQKSIARKGTNKIISLDVADLPNGIYLATIISDKKERRMLGKFTINR